MKKKIKICFISKELYPYLVKTQVRTAGGAERQQYLLAKKFRNNGLDVSFIVGDYGQNNIEIKNGFKIIKSFYLFQNIKILRLFFDLILLFSAMRRANADIYYNRILHYHTAFAALICKILHKKFIYSVGNDISLNINIIKKTNPFKRYLFYKFGILSSDIIIVQTESQRNKIKEIYNKNCIKLKNIYDLESYTPKKTKPPIILWIGAIKKVKNPEIFLKIAESLPNISFRMIGGPTGDELYYNKIKNESKKIKNLQFLGYISPNKIKKYYNEATLFLNTSKYEGFPNTYLEAWSRYVPVVSLDIDPDEVICKYKLGYHSKTFDKMINHIKLLIENESLRKQMGINARKYVEREHDIKKVYKKYLKLFEKLFHK